jgi:regulator of G-protein signaling
MGGGSLGGEALTSMPIPQVSLDSRVREGINRKMQEPSAHTFDDAQLQIYTLMHRDSYPRFLSSPTYRALLLRGAPQSSSEA